VRVEETSGRVVWVRVRIAVLVVHAMIPHPVEEWVL
jgi:hypothetical protein